jgi:predicted NBD/HSP70 family sugar kinase
MAVQRADLNGFAVDLGGTKIAAARIGDGEILARHQVRTDGAAGPEAQVEAMAACLRELGYNRGSRLGVAVAGRIDRAGIWHAVNTGILSSLGSFALAEAVERAMGPAACLNDADAATLAEARFGAGQGFGNFAYLTVSTGVGGGLWLGGRLLQSVNGLAGHVGFVTSPFSREPCGSGRRGTVESVAGGRAIAAAAGAVGHTVDARAVHDAAVAGEAWAEAIFARSSDAIATLIADLTAILDLEAVALGGSVGLSSGYIDRVRDSLTTEPRLFRPTVSAARLGAEAPLFGALAKAMETRD